MEWTPARIRLFREVGLGLSQEDFGKATGFAKRTIGNAERGSHPPGLALRRALDQALETASDAQRDRFLAAIVVHNGAEPGVQNVKTIGPVHPQGMSTSVPHEVITARSSARTRILLDTVQARLTS